MCALYAARGAPWHAGYYAQIALGVVRAANEDPLFDSELTGAEVTACLLISHAKESSDLLPWARRGRSRHGLYQLIPPSSVRITINDLTDPLTASKYAIDLMRQSFVVCAPLPWPERLAWELELGDRPQPSMDPLATTALSRQVSRTIMDCAKELFLRHFHEPLVHANGQQVAGASWPFEQERALPPKQAQKRAPLRLRYKNA